MTFKPYLDFYTQHDVSPVQNTIDQSFLNKRNALYHQLKLNPYSLRGKTVLEFGPGNGINSIYTHSLQPKNYVLVDANPTALENCKKHFQSFYPNQQNYQIVNSEIEQYSSDDRFDLVICEGLLPHQHDPVHFLSYITRHVALGGHLILTCHDFISNFSEILRGFLGFLVLDQEKAFDDQVSDLVDFFTPHLKSLQSMTRKYSDWVIDNILYIDYWKTSPFFSIKESLEALDREFIIYGSSPHMLTDWRWYKSIGTDSNMGFNEQAVHSYNANIHNFLDHRLDAKPRCIQKNLELYRQAKEIREVIASYVEDRSTEKMGEIDHLLKIFEIECKAFSVEISRAIRCYRTHLGQVFKGNTKQRFPEFEKFWGRGMQFINFVRVK